MKEYKEFVVETKKAEEARKKVKAKIKKDSRIQSILIYDTMVSIYATYNIAHYEPINTGVVTMERKIGCSEALLNTKSAQEYNDLERGIKEEAIWLKEYVEKLFNIQGAANRQFGIRGILKFLSKLFYS
jgi:hypothetical protein